MELALFEILRVLVHIWSKLNLKSLTKILLVSRSNLEQGYLQNKIQLKYRKIDIFSFKEVLRSNYRGAWCEYSIRQLVKCFKHNNSIKNTSCKAERG